MNIAVLSFDKPESACANYRIHTPLHSASGKDKVFWAVQSQGDTHSIDGEALQKADAIVVQRFFPLDFTEQALEACFASGKPVIYDTDDLLSDIPDSNPHHPLAQRTLLSLEKLGKRFTLMTASTRSIATSLKLFNPRTVVVPNRLDTTLWAGPSQKDEVGPVRLLYAGTETHIQDLESIEAPLLNVLNRHEGDVELTLFGCTTEALQDHPFVRLKSAVDSYAAYCAGLQETPFDIGLAPLIDSPFNRAKSHVKWLEYSACGSPGIYSALPPYDDVITPRNGMTASTGQEWHDALEALISQADKRERMARRSWADVTANHVGNTTDGDLLRICYRLTGRTPAS